uniref:Probable RNA polymerase II nuclear localization protein SLC7A6OS n=1 Tax=Parascaris univalens TaxID=6257 RepID=A0A915BZW1_PARUN
MENSCGPSASQMAATVLRIRRKRTADPHEALVVSVKRLRQGGPEGKSATTVLYSLAGTSSVPEVSAIDGLPSSANVIDFDPTKASEQSDMQMDICEDKATSDEQQYLSAFCDGVGEGGVPLIHAARKVDQITLNGIPMTTVNTSDLYPEADYVFDFYWNPTAVICNSEDLEIRPANQHDIELYFNGDDTDSSVEADDEDDSNDENNWRNEYPDDEDTQESDDERSSDSDDLNERFDECDFYGSDSDQ